MAKKRKITPTLITPMIDPNRNRSIATEADTVYLTPELAAERTEREPVNDLSDNLCTGAYLGNKSITRFDILGFDSIGHSESPLEEDKQFILCLRLG